MMLGRVLAGLAMLAGPAAAQRMESPAGLMDPAGRAAMGAGLLVVRDLQKLPPEAEVMTMMAAMLAGRRWLWLRNDGPRAIEAVHLSASSRPSWGTDRLGQNGLGRGQRLAVFLPPGECLVDLRVRFSGGEVQERWRVDACAPGDAVFP